MTIKLQRPSYAHEDITFSGRVARSTGGDDSAVEVEISSADSTGVTTVGSVGLRRCPEFREG